MSEKLKCDWRGYGFGASYLDAACCDGTVWDEDSGDAPGELSVGGEETCPQCGGSGEYEAGCERGVMALARQRDRQGFDEWLEAVEDEDVRGELTKRIDAMFALVRKLEEPTKDKASASCR